MTSGVLQISLDQPFQDQKPGTSGLRKSSRQFETPHYLESFIEAILRTVPGIAGGTLVVGGDGRYGNRRAISSASRRRIRGSTSQALPDRRARRNVGTVARRGSSLVLFGR